MAINTNDAAEVARKKAMSPKNCIDTTHGIGCRWATPTLKCKRQNYNGRDLKMIRLDLSSDKAICEAFIVGSAFSVNEKGDKHRVKKFGAWDSE